MGGCAQPAGLTGFSRGSRPAARPNADSRLRKRSRLSPASRAAIAAASPRGAAVFLPDAGDSPPDVAHPPRSLIARCSRVLGVRATPEYKFRTGFGTTGSDDPKCIPLLHLRPRARDPSGPARRFRCSTATAIRGGPATAHGRPGQAEPKRFVTPTKCCSLSSCGTTGLTPWNGHNVLCVKDLIAVISPCTRCAERHASRRCPAAPAPPTGDHCPTRTFSHVRRSRSS